MQQHSTKRAPARESSSQRTSIGRIFGLLTVVAFAGAKCKRLYYHRCATVLSKRGSTDARA
jgi:hypothetical protein